MPWAYIRIKEKFDGPIFGGWGEGEAYIQGGAYILEEKHFNL